MDETQAGTPETGRRAYGPIAVVLALLALCAICVRLYVSANVMNLYMPYTDPETGGLLEKFHFGTYAIFALTLVALFSRPVYLVGNEIAKFRALLRFAAFSIAVFAYLAVAGAGRTPAPFIDTYATAALAGLLLYAQNPAARQFIGDAVVAFNVANALLATLEAVLKVHFLPFPVREEIFRPVGFMDFPLTLGLVCAGSIAFVPLTSWRTWVKTLAVLVLFVGTAASGARFALVVGALEILGLILFVPWARLSPRLERLGKIVTLVLALGGGVVLLGAAAAGGLLSRFQDGIVDANAFARVDIYRIYALVSPQQILFGANLNEIAAIVKKQIGLPFIESSIVYFTFQLGAILALIFVFLFGRLLWRLLKGLGAPARIGTLAFITIGLSNNTYSTKSAVVTMLVVLLVALAAPRTTQTDILAYSRQAHQKSGGARD